MSERYLLDASALLALLQDEPGADRVAAVLENASIHALQLAEVVKKLNRPGIDPGFCREAVRRLALPVVEEITAEEAYATSAFCTPGISLGDRVCLAVAKARDLTVVTADREMAELAEALLGKPSPAKSIPCPARRFPGRNSGRDTIPKPKPH